MPVHTIAPVFDKDSRVLILGSFPSVLSRKTEFFYGHPQNRFWQVLSQVFGLPLPVNVEEKRELLYASHVAVWDVIASCDITGSSDSSITNVVPNDISRILDFCDIRAIFANGQTAGRLYQKFIYPKTGREATVLPSTSPANAAFSLERLCEVWAQIGDYGQSI
ncbi:MAG: DNA-deoxyinosine glycosylase [Oscillospiraceae bacterium]|jgi:hypoxanthine-DNA glycosylase|nr:DNA-deoxyinosine glycosylase [Oscillospiraceae bacterium]